MNTYRFRNRLPKPGEGKSPRAELDATRDSAGIVTIWLYDVIDSWGGWWGISADEVRQALEAFPAAQVSEIHIHVNSPGGDVFEAVAINNLLAAHPAKVRVMVDGLAASAASVVAVRADELVMGIGTELMIHDVQTIAIGPASDIRAAADLVDKLSDDLALQYAMKAGGDPEEWRAAMLAETWYTATEAVAAGLADRVGTLTESAPVETVTEGADDLDDLELLFAATLDSDRARAALTRGQRPTLSLAGPDDSDDLKAASDPAAEEAVDPDAETRAAYEDRAASATIRAYQDRARAASQRR